MVTARNELYTWLSRHSRKSGPYYWDQRILRAARFRPRVGK